MQHPGMTRLQMKLDKRFSKGLQALVAYTFSRSEDTAFILHPAFETRAPSIGKAVDIPHNLVISWAYELPVGPGKPYLSGGSAADAAASSKAGPSTASRSFQSWRSAEHSWLPRRS